MAQAQGCGVPYSYRDRNALKGILLGSVANNLRRMHAIAVAVASGSTSPSITLAFDSQFQGLREEIDTLGKANYPKLTKRSREWLSRVVNEEFLQLNGATVRGNLEKSQQENAGEAAERINSAVWQIWICAA